MECLETGIPFIVLLIFMLNQIPEIKIGILLPKSSLYPSMGFDIRDGLKTGLALDKRCDYKLIFDNIGHGGNDDLVYQKTERLLLEEDVAVVVAFLDHDAAIKLDKLFVQARRLLIVLDPGAHTPLLWETASPFRYTLSLQSALNNYITGTLAANNGAANAMFSTSFYEGGYLQCNTYLKGFQKAGGNIVYHAVVPFKIQDFNTGLFQQAIDEHKPDTVLAQFSAESGAFFLQQYSAAGLAGKARLFASPFMLDEQWIGTLPYVFEGITGSVPWCSKLEHEENIFFTGMLKEHADKEANLFSLLGWEAALLIRQFADQYHANGQNAGRAISTFRPEGMVTPRGQLHLHEPSGVFFAPAYQVEMIEDVATGNCALALKNELFYDQQQFINEIPEGAFSKWNNTYLSI